jgi:hypothetical protein
MAIRIPTEDSAPSVAFEDAVHYVFELLDSIPDFRDPRGKQIELKGTLALALLATTAGHPRYTDIEQWGKDREENLIPLLGLVRAPSDSTIRRILQGIDPEALREVLRKSAAMILSDKRKLATAKDGKTMRAARIEDERSAHIVSLVEQNTGVIMDADYCRRGEGELAAARRLKATAAAGGAEIALETGDALYTNSSDAQRTVAEGGHYLLKVKKTPPSSSMTSSSASPTTPPSPTKAGPPTSATAA